MSNREIVIRYRTTEEGKRYAEAIGARMDIPVSSVLRLLVREKAEQLGIVQGTQADHRKLETSGNRAA